MQLLPASCVQSRNMKNFINHKYAAFVDAVYPIGSVTYEGGAFSDDNFYGENFAEDSKMQYNNTVRGYQAIVDGTTDILFCAAPSTQQEQYIVKLR